jgi:hypothetical protein
MVRFLKITLVSVALLLVNTAANAQCAMCRATLENNFSNGGLGPVANINLGILYLLVFPYILVAVVAYFWYKKSKGAQAA